MRIVMYKNPNGIFDFELPDVIDRLKYYSDQNVGEATEILDAVVRGGGIGSSIKKLSLSRNKSSFRPKRAI
jgi:hypothetical protein